MQTQSNVLNFRAPDALVAALAREAARSQTSMSAIIREAVRERVGTH